MLMKIKNSGMKTAVVSNKADYGVQELCKEYFPGMFDYAVGEKEGIRRKPCPDSVNEVLRQMGVTKEEAVYIGDSDVDFETSRNAQMGCDHGRLGISNGKFFERVWSTVCSSQHGGGLGKIKIMHLVRSAHRNKINEL